MYKLFLYVPVSLLLISYSLFCTSCQKEYSCEGGLANCSESGTAVFTSAGTGGACDNAISSGQFYTGVALSSANIVQLNVKVTAVGTYTITTNSVDGFQFLATGNFADTGTQTITLKGSGTPASEGSFTFTSGIGSGCTFIIQVTKAPPVLASYTFAGAPDYCTTPVIGGHYTSGDPLVTSNTVVVKVNVTAIGAYSITTDTLDGIYFSASGTFANTGSQSVTLAGSGTPEFARNLTFTTLASGIAGCSFNLVITDPAPLATYVLQSGFGTPAPCICTTQGNYISGTSLSGSNTITMLVYVAIAGNFTIATNTQDGIMFSYSGTYSTTGDQYVTLKGTGTPINQGTFTFIPNIVGPHPLGGEACAFAVDVQ